MPPIKQTDTNAAVRSDRPVKFPEVVVKTYLGDNALTVAQAKEILGWEEESAEHPITVSVPEGLKTLDGKKVWCLNNLHNRPYTDSWSSQLAQDILNRNWADSRNGDGMTVNGETGIISKTAQVLSMQHRLIALVKSGEMWAGPQKDHWAKKWETEPTMECILVFGVSEHPHVTRTLDNVRPRDLGDVFSTDTALFGNVKSAADRRVMTTMLANAVKMMWARTGAKAGPFNPYMSNSEGCDFIDRHPKLKSCVKHVWDEYKSDWAKHTTRMGAGGAAAFMYLMASSATEEAGAEKYRTGGRKESALDLSRYEQASEFWTLMCSNSPVMASVATAFGDLFDDCGKRGEKPGAAPKIAILLNAWARFVAGKPLGVEDVCPQYGNPNEDGVRKLISTSVGGIDFGEKVSPDHDEVADPPLEEGQVQDSAEEIREEKSKPSGKNKQGLADAVERKAEANRKTVADLASRHPGLLILFVGPKKVKCWDDHATVAAKELGLLTKPQDGMLLCEFPAKDLEDNLAILTNTQHAVGVCEPFGESVKVTEHPANTKAKGKPKSKAKGKAENAA